MSKLTNALLAVALLFGAAFVGMQVADMAGPVVIDEAPVVIDESSVGTSYTRFTDLDFTRSFAVGTFGNEVEIIDSDGNWEVGDDLDLGFGTDSPVTIEWTSADPDAVCLLIDLPLGVATDVPVVMVASADSNFGYFGGNVIKEPTLAVENLAGSSFIAMDFSATTLSRLHSGGAATTLTIATDVAGADIILDAADAAAGTAQQYVSITGSTPAHASGTPTDIFLDITPTLGINTATATAHLVDLSFASPAWASGGATSTLRAIYIDPTIGDATAGTNVIALIDVPAIGDLDAEVDIYGVRVGNLTQEGGTQTANFIDIGTGWDAGLTSASPVALTGANADLDVEDNITAGDIVIDETAGVLDFSGTTGTISTSTAGASLVIDVADAAVNSAQTYVEITGTTPIHTTLSGTDIFLDISPTIGLSSGTAVVTHLADLTFSTPAWATGTNTVRGVYLAPTIGDASGGTNTVNMIEIANFTGDASVGTVTGLKIGTSNGAGATEHAIDIGTGWDIGINSASTIDVQAAVILANDESLANAADGVVTLTGDDDTGIQLQVISADHDTTGDASLVLDADAGGDDADTWTITSQATGNDLSILNAATEVINVTSAGAVQIDSTLQVDGGTISDSTAAGTILLDAADQTANTAKTYVSITGTTPAHTAGATTNDLFLDISPTIGIAAGTATANTHLIDMAFTTPVWVTAGATSTVRGIYFDPTIGAATNGTNTLALFDVAAIDDSDDQVNIYGIRMGAMTGAGGTENAIDIGAGWDAGFDSASPIVLTTSAGDIDVQGEDITNSIAGGGLDFAATQAAAGTGTDFYSFEATIAAHQTNTPDDVIIELSPTLGLPIVTNTVHFVESIFTLPSYATNAKTNDVVLWYIDPTIGDPTDGTNNLVIMDVAAISDLDEEQDFYGVRFGNMTQEGTQVAEALVVGTGFDYGLNSDSNVKALALVIDDGDADLTLDSDNQTNASAALSIPDFTDATADVLTTNTFVTVLPFITGGLWGEDTDGAGTNGGGMVGSTVDVTTHDYNSGAAGANDVLCKVYDLTSTTWDDLSTSATLSGGADWAANYQLLPDADAEETGDAFAIGFDEKFCEIVFNDLTTDAGALATWGGDGGKWQYSTGAAAWTDLVVYDGTDDEAEHDGLQALQQVGAITFVPPANWGLATYDGEEAYWVQYVLTGAQLTQTPLIDNTNKDEPIIGIPTTDSFVTPFNMSLAEVRVTNIGAAVHNQNVEFIVGNFTTGTFSAVLTWTSGQYVDRFDLATEIACSQGDIIGIMVTDDNAATANPTWAVEFEVTYED